MTFYVFYVGFLIQGQRVVPGIVDMANSTICELVPFDFELSELFFDLVDEPLNERSFSCHFQVVDMLGHHHDKLVVVIHVGLVHDDQSVVDGSRLESKSCRGLTELDAGRTGCVNQSSAWHITVQHLVGYIKVFEASEPLDQSGRAEWQRKVDFTFWLARDFRELLVRCAL